MGKDRNALPETWQKANDEYRDGDAQKRGMTACAVVRDRSGNTHKRSFSASSAEGGKAEDHAEPRLLNEIEKHYSESGMGLNFAKVTIYLANSPCKTCTDKLLEWYKKTEKAITKRDDKGDQTGQVNFVFSYRYIFKEGQGKSNSNTMWGSEKEAEEAYEKIVSAAGKIEGTGKSGANQGKPKSVPRIKFVDMEKKVQIGDNAKVLFVFKDDDFPALGSVTKPTK